MSSPYFCRRYLLILIALIGLFFVSACSTVLRKPSGSITKPKTVEEMKSAGISLANEPDKLPNLQYGLFEANKGWLKINSRLFLTADNGKSWDEITPPDSQNLTLARVHFLDPNSVWAFYINSGGDTVSYALKGSNDAGKTWNDLSAKLNEQLISALPNPEGEVQIQRFNLGTGWILIKAATGVNFSNGILARTRDGGLSWELLKVPSAETLTFADDTKGYILSDPGKPVLFATADAGATWNELNLEIPSVDGADQVRLSAPLFQPGGYGAIAVYYYKADTLLKMVVLQTNDAGISWITGGEDLNQIKQTPGQEPFIHLLPDGNLSRWNRSQMQAPQDQSQTDQVMQITHLEASGAEMAWGTFISGSCSAQVVGIENQLFCTQNQSMGFTLNGGKSWEPLPLPIDISKKSVSVFSKSPEATGPLPTPGLPSLQAKALNPSTTLGTGQGFDTCEIPDLQSMQAFMSGSPYNSVNLYIGGSARACLNKKLDYNYITALSDMGWSFIPTWVGPQPYCTDYRSRMPSNPAAAYRAGVENANQAMDVMFSLGLTDANGNGGIVYYDLEYYSGNDDCVSATDMFFQGWTKTLQARGAISGVYGSYYPPNLAALHSSSTPPEAIWIARWITNYYDPNVSVYWASTVFSNDWWNQHQRLRQYTGGHYEAWGGRQIFLDSNVLDGPVSLRVFADNRPPVTTFVYTGSSENGEVYGSNGVMILKASDSQSGVIKTYYKLNGGALTEYTAPVPISTEGTHTVEFYSVDNTNNEETPKTQSFILDNTPPSASISLQGTLSASGWYASNVIMSLSAADALSGIKSTEYSIGPDFVWKTYTAPVTIDLNGQVEIHYRATDVAGNVSAVSTETIYVDTLPPSNPTSVNPNCQAGNGYWQGFCYDASFTWAGASDLGSGLAAYDVYWGPDPKGSTATYTTTADMPQFDAPKAHDRSINYLRIRTQDELGHWSNWETVFTLMYDARMTNIIFAPLISK